MMKTCQLLSLLASSHCFMEAPFSEEQVWKWGLAPHGMLPWWQITYSWSCNFPTSLLLLSFYPTKRTCLCSDLWLLWHARHVNYRRRVYIGSTRKQNSRIPLTLTVWTCLNRILAHPNVSWWCHGKIRPWFQSVDATYILCCCYLMLLGLIQPALKCGSSWMNIQSSTNPQSAKSANSQTLWALEHKYFKLWHTAEGFMLLTDFPNMTRRLGSLAGASKVLYQ